MYRPGGKVYFRSLTLERFSLKPADAILNLIYTVTDGNGAEVYRLPGTPHFVDDKGQPLLGPDKEPHRGVGAGEYPIQAVRNGGEYTLTVSEANNRFAP